MNHPYGRLLRAERPVHHQDAFAAKHPPMPREKRAKLFAPFDALSGYSEALDEQETVYREREKLSEEARQELDEKLQRLWRSYRRSKAGTKYLGGGAAAPFEPPIMTLEYFRESPGQCGRGQYHTVTGKVIKLDLQQKYLLLDTGGACLCVPLLEIRSFLAPSGPG